MKKEERIKRVDDALHLIEEAQKLLKDIIWEGQEGQPDHFDKLQKLEQVMLCGSHHSLRVACMTLSEMANSYKFCNFKETDE
jgi:hypothetical protein